MVTNWCVYLSDRRIYWDSFINTDFRNFATVAEEEFENDFNNEFLRNIEKNKLALLGLMSWNLKKNIKNNNEEKNETWNISRHLYVGYFLIRQKARF